jgi:hypothetical protein
MVFAVSQMVVLEVLHPSGVRLIVAAQTVAASTVAESTVATIIATITVATIVMIGVRIVRMMAFRYGQLGARLLDRHKHRHQPQYKHQYRHRLQYRCTSPSLSYRDRSSALQLLSLLVRLRTVFLPR